MINDEVQKNLEFSPTIYEIKMVNHLATGR